ncbi:MAG: hypothetical protein JSV96_03270 [Candidatus Aminicenantes bacterium]|nr:MAG: hypothetical protein JSV96_03270 [Candidatus Aminicenantes bacterium]
MTENSKYHFILYPVITISLFVLFYIFTGIFAANKNINHVKAQLIPEVKSIKPGEPFCMAVRLVMNEGWHTYWKNPGDSGAPTEIKWDLPEGFTGGDIQWPYPKKFDGPPLVSFGYKGEVFLLTEIKTSHSISPGSKAKIRASVDWLVCKEVCIPCHADLSIELPVKDEKPRIDDEWVDSFEKTREKLPKAYSGWKISASVKQNQILIQIAPPSWFKNILSNMIFFPEHLELVDYSESQNLKKPDGGYIIEAKRSQFASKLPSRLKGVLFSEKGWGYSEKERALLVDVPFKKLNK